RQASRGDVPEGGALAGGRGEGTTVRRKRDPAYPPFVSKAHGAQSSDGPRRKRIAVSIRSRALFGRRLLRGVFRGLLLFGSFRAERSMGSPAGSRNQKRQGQHAHGPTLDFGDEQRRHPPAN